MNGENKNKNQVAMLVEEAKNIAIIPSKLAGLDAFCAGAALFHMLKAQDKNVSFLYTGKLPEKSHNIISSEDVTSDVGKRSLTVSIDYSGTEASKVRYSTEDDVLYLRVSPISPDFDKDTKIRSNILGFDFDVIFVVGAQRVYDLGKMYDNLDTVSKVSKIINIDNTEKNERFGFVNVIDNSVNSTSHLIMKKVDDWDLTISEKAAKVLLRGIISKEAPHIS